MNIVFNSLNTLFCFFLLLSAFNTNASVQGIGVAGGGSSNPCLNGTMGILDDSPYGCSWISGSTGEERSLVRWAAGQPFIPIDDGVLYTFGFEEGYVSFSGLYSMRMYLCPSEGLKTCTASTSSQYFDSVNSVQLSSKRTVLSQNPRFGGFSGIVGVGSNACYAYVDAYGNVWKSDGGFFCQDARELPSEPSFCYFNNNSDLDVNLGVLERSEIPTTPTSSGKAINKQVEVICTGDAGTDVKIQFEYMPLSISGTDTISTTATGVGISLNINGHKVSPDSIFYESYQTGVDFLSLNFEALRDPSQLLTDIPTGGFTAQAIMIVTAQ